MAADIFEDPRQASEAGKDSVAALGDLDWPPAATSIFMVCKRVITMSDNKKRWFVFL
jgi:hypothetical protein